MKGSPVQALPVRGLRAFFPAACLISWTLWAPLWLPALGGGGLPVLPHHHALGALGPIAAAFLLTARESGAAGILSLARRMVAWRGRLPWILVAGFAPLALLAAGVLAVRLTGSPGPAAGAGLASPEYPALTGATFFLYNLLTFGFGEEVGWRGYALPRLQARRGALAATALLTAGWAIWHVPLFLYRPGYAAMGVGGIAGWLVSLFLGAVLLTWLYNESRGSLLVVALFHASVDVAFTSTLSTAAVTAVTGALITLWGIAVIVLAGPRELSRRGRETVGARGQAPPDS